MTTRLPKETLIYSWIRIWILFLAVSCGACAAPISNAQPSSESDPRIMIYLVSHGWHAGIVVRYAGISDVIWPAAEDFPDAEYLEVGWGDMNYYQTPNAHIGLILKAALLPSASVLHIVGFSGPVQTYFPHSEIIEIELSSAGFGQLSRTIAASFATNNAGDIISLGRGLYGNSHFYQSNESYHLFNTCNVWTARTLRAAGLPITPMGTVTVEDLMSQAHKIGTMVHSGSGPSN